MEYESVINVKKRISPLTYIGLILLVVALGFASMFAVLYFAKPAESYKTAETNYFSAMSDAYSAEQDLSASMEYELQLAMNTDSPFLEGYFDSLNNTVLKGYVGVDGSKIDYALDYFNGNKKVLGIAMWMNENVLSVAVPGLSDIMLTLEIPDEYMSGNYASLDYEALEVTLAKISDKYFELVGEPEIINKNVVVEKNGISAECVVYRIEMNEEFLNELFVTAVDAFLENKNLIEICGGDEIEKLLREAREELNSAKPAEDYEFLITMDVYASENVICKREISLVLDSKEAAKFDITSIEDDGKGYFSFEMDAEGEGAAFENIYTKDGDKTSGTLTLSLSSSMYSMANGDIFTLTYKDAVFDKNYGYAGEFNLSVPTSMINIKGVSNLDDKYNFNCDVDVMGQNICNISGYFKYHDEYTGVGMPDKSQFEEHSVNVDSPNSPIDDEAFNKIGEDVMNFIGGDIYETFADENGNFDIVGAIVSMAMMYTTNAAGFSSVDDFAAIY